MGRIDQLHEKKFTKTPSYTARFLRTAKEISSSMKKKLSLKKVLSTGLALSALSGPLSAFAQEAAPEGQLGSKNKLVSIKKDRAQDIENDEVVNDTQESTEVNTVPYAQVSREHYTKMTNFGAQLKVESIEHLFPGNASAEWLEQRIENVEKYVKLMKDWNIDHVNISSRIAGGETFESIVNDYLTFTVAEGETVSGMIAKKYGKKAYDVFAKHILKIKLLGNGKVSYNKSYDTVAAGQTFTLQLTDNGIQLNEQRVLAELDYGTHSVVTEKQQEVQQVEMRIEAERDGCEVDVEVTKLAPYVASTIDTSIAQMTKYAYLSDAQKTQEKHGITSCQAKHLAKLYHAVKRGAEITPVAMRPVTNGEKLHNTQIVTLKIQEKGKSTPYHVYTYANEDGYLCIANLKQSPKKLQRKFFAWNGMSTSIARVSSAYHDVAAQSTVKYKKAAKVVSTDLNIPETSSLAVDSFLPGESFYKGYYNLTSEQKEEVRNAAYKNGEDLNDPSLQSLVEVLQKAKETYRYYVERKQINNPSFVEAQKVLFFTLPQTVGSHIASKLKEVEQHFFLTKGLIEGRFGDQISKVQTFIDNKDRAGLDEYLKSHASHYDYFTTIDKYTGIQSSLYQTIGRFFYANALQEDAMERIYDQLEKTKEKAKHIFEEIMTVYDNRAEKSSSYLGIKYQNYRLPENITFFKKEINNEVFIDFYLKERNALGQSVKKKYTYREGDILAAYSGWHDTVHKEIKSVLADPSKYMTETDILFGNKTRYFNNEFERSTVVNLETQLDKYNLGIEVPMDMKKDMYHRVASGVQSELHVPDIHQAAHGDVGNISFSSEKSEQSAVELNVGPNTLAGTTQYGFSLDVWSATSGISNLLAPEKEKKKQQIREKLEKLADPSVEERKSAELVRDITRESLLLAAHLYGIFGNTTQFTKWGSGVARAAHTLGLTTLPYWQEKIMTLHDETTVLLAADLVLTESEEVKKVLTYRLFERELASKKSLQKAEGGEKYNEDIAQIKEAMTELAQESLVKTYLNYMNVVSDREDHYIKGEQNGNRDNKAFIIEDQQYRLDMDRLGAYLEKNGIHYLPKHLGTDFSIAHGLKSLPTRVDTAVQDYVVKANMTADDISKIHLRQKDAVKSTNQVAESIAEDIDSVALSRRKKFIEMFREEAQDSAMREVVEDFLQDLPVGVGMTTTDNVFVFANGTTEQQIMKLTESYFDELLAYIHIHLLDLRKNQRLLQDVVLDSLSRQESLSQIQQHIAMIFAAETVLMKGNSVHLNHITWGVTTTNVHDMMVEYLVKHEEGTDQLKKVLTPLSTEMLIALCKAVVVTGDQVTDFIGDIATVVKRIESGNRAPYTSTLYDNVYVSRSWNGEPKKYHNDMWLDYVRTHGGNLLGDQDKEKDIRLYMQSDTSDILENLEKKLSGGGVFEALQWGTFGASEARASFRSQSKAALYKENLTKEQLLTLYNDVLNVYYKAANEQEIWKSQLYTKRLATMDTLGTMIKKGKADVRMISNSVAGEQAGVVASLNSKYQDIAPETFMQQSVDLQTWRKSLLSKEREVAAAVVPVLGNGELEVLSRKFMDYQSKTLSLSYEIEKVMKQLRDSKESISPEKYDDYVKREQALEAEGEALKGALKPYVAYVEELATSEDYATIAQKRTQINDTMKREMVQYINTLSQSSQDIPAHTYLQQEEYTSLAQQERLENYMAKREVLASKRTQVVKALPGLNKNFSTLTGLHTTGYLFDESSVLGERDFTMYMNNSSDPLERIQDDIKRYDDALQKIAVWNKVMSVFLSNKNFEGGTKVQQALWFAENLVSLGFDAKLLKLNKNPRYTGWSSFALDVLVEENVSSTVLNNLGVYETATNKKAVVGILRGILMSTLQHKDSSTGHTLTMTEWIKKIWGDEVAKLSHGKENNWSVRSLMMNISEEEVIRGIMQSDAVIINKKDTVNTQVINGQAHAAQHGRSADVQAFKVTVERVLFGNLERFTFFLKGECANPLIAKGNVERTYLTWMTGIGGLDTPLTYDVTVELPTIQEPTWDLVLEKRPDVQWVMASEKKVAPYNLAVLGFIPLIGEIPTPGGGETPVTVTTDGQGDEGVLKGKNKLTGKGDENNLNANTNLTGQGDESTLVIVEEVTTGCQTNCGETTPDPVPVPQPGGEVDQTQDNDTTNNNNVNDNSDFTDGV